MSDLSIYNNQKAKIITKYGDLDVGTCGVLSDYHPEKRTVTFSTSHSASGALMDYRDVPVSFIEVESMPIFPSIQSFKEVLGVFVKTWQSSPINVFHVGEIVTVLRVDNSEGVTYLKRIRDDSLVQHRVPSEYVAVLPETLSVNLFVATGKEQLNVGENYVVFNRLTGEVSAFTYKENLDVGDIFDTSDVYQMGKLSNFSPVR